MVGIDKIGYFNNIPYVIKRQLPVDIFTFNGKLEKKAVQMYMEYIFCNHVLQTQEHFLFCQTIDDAEIIEIIEK